jgi:phosphoglycerate dehydrogenase-like enzyme
MEKINVLFVYKSHPSIPYHMLPEDSAAKIRNVSTNINLASVDLAPEDKPENDPDRLRLNKILSGAEVIIGDRLPHNLVKVAPGLKWYQSMLVGVDRMLNDTFNTDFRGSKIKMTNVRGIGSLPIAECVIALILMLAKKMPANFKSQELKQWRPVKTELLKGKTLGIVGLGSIGREVARLARVFSMRIIATNEPARPSKFADLVMPTDQLPQLLRECDYLVLTVPLTPSTTKLIGEHQLRLMKPTSFLVNVSRGLVTDEEALARALKENWIAGAGLDVFGIEPLPESSPLWGIPGVIATPHIAAYIENYDKIAIDMFCENFKRYLNGQKLQNIINKKKGY